MTTATRKKKFHLHGDSVVACAQIIGRIQQLHSQGFAKGLYDFITYFKICIYFTPQKNKCTELFRLKYCL
jgi:hypothetical protein